MTKRHVFHESILTYFCRINILLAAVFGMGGKTAQAAELRIGWKIERETLAEVWGLDAKQAHKDFGENENLRVKLVGTDIPANILWPGEQAELVFQFENLTDAPQKLKGIFDIERYEAYDLEIERGKRVLGTTGLKKTAEIEQIPLAIELKPQGYQVVTIKPAIPETFGGYVVLVDINGQGRFFGAGLARVRKNVWPKTLYRRFTMDAHSVDQMSRLAAYPNRAGLNWKPVTDADFEQWYADNSRIQALREYHEVGMTTTVEFGHCVEPSGPRAPLGRPRPHLYKNNVMKTGKQDYSWMPQYDKDFEEFVYRLCCDQGYPNGAINGVMLWNEPWEGTSISGWQGDMIRYREIYAAMARGVERARKDAGVKVLIGGCDSTSNTFDKLFPDGDDWLKWLDFMSIHYQGNNPRSNVKKFMNRKHYQGRVLIWDTESWAANTDDGVAAMIAGCASFGYDRIVGLYGGGAINNMQVKVRQEDGADEKQEMPHAWSINAAIAASQSFVGERPFRELLFKDGLPWIMVFDGMPGSDGKARPDDGTLVVVGDLPQAFRGAVTSFPLRSVRGLPEVHHEIELKQQLARLPQDAPLDERQEIQNAIDAYEPILNAQMTLSDGEGVFRLYDTYGNRIAATGGAYHIQLGMIGYYLRTDGSPGSFDKLLDAVRYSRIEGYEPLATVCRDMMRPIGKKPTVQLKLTNILNRPISGMLDLSLGGLRTEAPRKLRFKPHETKSVSVKIVGGQAVPDNTYPLTLRFDAGKDGLAIHEEDLHVNLIGRRTVQVDGKLDDWNGSLPQPIRPAGKVVATLEEVAWRPYEKLPDALESGFATTYAAHDEDYFYFAARVADETPHPGMVRIADRDDSAYFYPRLSIEYDSDESLVMTEAPSSAEHEKALLQHPDKDGKRVNRQWEYERPAVSFAIDFDIPFDRPQKVSLFIPPWWRQEHSMEMTVIDLDTDKRLDWKRCPGAPSYDGQYLSFNASGRIRAKITGKTWLHIGVAGVFFDAPAVNPNDSRVKTGKILDIDYETAGNWKGRYGVNGYHVVGARPQLPDGVDMSIPQKIIKKEHLWPEGVRRYSYRKNPDLPTSWGSTRADNVQVAFNAIPAGDPEAGEWASEPFPEGTRWHYTGYTCTDYEYALNPVAREYGGGTEIWRMQYPDIPPKHFYPRQPKHELEGPVTNGKLVIRHEGNTRIVECALPWSEIPHVKKLRDAGKPVKFSCRINDDAGRSCMELARERSVSKQNNAFKVDWEEHWANEVEFNWE